LRQFECLRERTVDFVSPGAAGDESTQIAPGPFRRNRERRRVEPVVNCGRPPCFASERGTLLTHACSWAVSLLASALSRAVRGIGEQGRLSRFRDDPRSQSSHINDFNFEEAVGLFAGLNIPPKKSYASSYSYGTVHEQQQKLLSGWVGALAPLLFPQAKSFALDFHPIPYRGDPTGLEQHYLPRRGKAGTSVQSFFAQEQESRVICYANANLTRNDQAGEIMRFVEFWRGITGADPEWLYFDSKATNYPGLSKLNQRGIWFVTIRRRGAAIL